MAKRIVFTEGGKGGVGKTTLLLSLIDYYDAQKVSYYLADFDIENQAKSGLKYWHKGAEKIDIHTRTGLDRLIDLAMDSEEDIILADMGAGSGAVAHKWFADIYPELSGAGVAATAIGVVTADPGSVASILTWAGALKNQVSYLIVLNELENEGEPFTYWHSKEASQFRELAKPVVITMHSRRPDLEQAARNHGVTLAQIADRKAKVPELTAASIVMRAQSYRRRLDAAFERAAEILLPS
ncbi:MAG TPA: hypothetical protein VIS99_12875 [Terrimicrobiaceae bacterium]